MAKSKYYAETYEALRPLTLFIFVLCPIVFFVICYIFSLLDYESVDIGIIEFLSFIVSGIIFFVVWKIKARKNEQKEEIEEEIEREITKTLIQRSLMKYLSQFPDENKQEFLNYLAQCPEEKRQEILLKILREYGMSSERK